MYTGPTISLTQLLDSRDKRVARQREWTAKFAKPLISFTINMVGPVKRNQIAEIAYAKGEQAIKTTCSDNNLVILAIQHSQQDTGLELLISIDTADAGQIKTLMIEIEERHPLGRLFDIDVIDNVGKAVSRDDIDVSRRRCLVCNQEAKICARSRSHSLQDLIDKMCEMVHDYH